jgi:hypothetical protein
MVSFYRPARVASVTIRTVTDDEKNSETTAPLLDPEDYYFENGLMVFTAAYHLKRG